ncbi:MAG: hypothetical protein JW849_02360 [Phycisphaerae bacterium]|nr:hypothetical protein [Phycisphaerae bacterium]
MLQRFTNHPAVRFYFAGDERFAEASLLRPGRTWIGLLLIGFLWGLASIGLWQGGRWLFGPSTGLCFLPSLLVAAGVLLGMYRRGAAALVRVLCGDQAVGCALTACFLALLWAGGLVELRPGYYLQEQALPNWLAWVRPESKIDRVLLLMPLWGAWSMLILPQFHRPGASDAALQAVARGGGPLTAALVMGALLACTIGYFAYLPWTQLTIPAAAILAAVGGGQLLVKRNGAMDRNVLLATNLLTQLALLLAAAANGNVRQW